MYLHHWLTHWNGDPKSVVFEPEQIGQVLADLDSPAYIVRIGDRVGVTNSGTPGVGTGSPLLASVAPLDPSQLGSPAFMRAYGLRGAYMAGAMANGIASEELVIALARSGYLGSFGAAGLLPDRIEAALVRFAREIPDATYACNLIHSPVEEALERGAVELFLRYGMRLVEASAFMGLTSHLVRYRLAGLELDAQQHIVVKNRIIAKVSRPEVAQLFLAPAPEAFVRQLLDQGLITPLQARLAAHVPMADDITVEADSGGHTDRRPQPVLVPTLRKMADAARRRYNYAQYVRVGAAGGIGTPLAACAAFAMGADYIVTGSINQSTIEAGTSVAVKKLLASAGIADCDMAPAADMFEMGVELQVLKKGVFFPMRAQKLYEFYETYESLEAIPAAERERLQTQILQRSLDDIWSDVQEYFMRRDPAQLERARQSPKRKMALVFRWYLGMSSRWAKVGEPGRVMDYQIWCGPAMGGFNDWVKGTSLEAPERRRVAEIADHLLRGAAFHARINHLRQQGVNLPSAASWYSPDLIPQWADVSAPAKVA